MRPFPGLVSYFVLAAIIATDAVWLAIGHVPVAFGDALAVPVVLMPVVSLTLIRLFPERSQRRTRIFRRLDVAMQGLIFICVTWAAALTLNHLAMTIRYPLADSLLARWDAALGFDWRDYFALVTGSAALRTLLEAAYNAFALVSLVAILALALTGMQQRAAYAIEAFLIASVLCIAIGLYFPAEGASAYYLRGSLTEDQLATFPGLYHLDALHRLRSGQLLVIDPLRLQGLVTFPSFHTAGGIVIAAALWRTRWFWPVAAYTALMIASTPIYGAHYVIDLIAGAAVAVVVLIALASLGYHRGVLQEGLPEVRAHP